MKIAYYYPPQIAVKIAASFCKYTKYEFLHQNCNASVDLIFAGSVSVLAQAMKAKLQFNKPLICWCWDIPYNWREWRMSEEGMKKNALRDTKNARYVSLLKKCDLVIAGSKWTQGVLKNQYDISSEQIYSYIDTDTIDSVPIQRKEKQIIQISRYFYNKKFEHTIMASRDLIDYKVVFIGFGLNLEYGNELKKCSDRYNKNVVFKEALSREDVIVNLRKSTVLASPSVFEGWGVTPIEALYCKVPVVLSDLEVFREVYGDNVLYHKMHDPEDMKEKLEFLIGDEKLQEKIVKDCQPIISEFTPKKFAVRWKRIVKKL